MRVMQILDVRVAAGFGALLLLLGVAGCGNDGPSTMPVTGEVYFNGQPVSAADVVFVSEGPVAKGTTDEQGKFTLRTYSDGDGAVPGKHRVTISKSARVESTPENPYAMGRNVLPARYANPNTSQLIAEVKQSGESNFRFELTD